MPIVKGKPEVISESRPKAVRTVRPDLARRIKANCEGRILPKGEVDPELLQKLRQRRAGQRVYERLTGESAHADFADMALADHMSRSRHTVPFYSEAAALGDAYVPKDVVTKTTGRALKFEKPNKADDIPLLSIRKFRRILHNIP